MRCYHTVFAALLLLLLACNKPSEPLVPEPPITNDTLSGTDITGDTLAKPGTVYVVTFDRLNFDIGYLYALDARTGKQKWRYTAPKRILSTPVYNNGIVYIGDVSGTIYAVDTATHSPRWTFQGPNGNIANATLANNMLYVQNGESWLYAIDLSTPHVKWQKFIGDSLNSSTGGSIPTVVNGTLYVGADDQHLYALDPLTGSEKWKYFDTYARGARIYSSPAVANGTVFFGDDNRNIIALDAVSGNERWHFEADGMIFSSPTVYNNVLYVSSEWHSLYALSPGTGKKIWSYYAEYGFDASPTVTDSTVYIGEDDAPQGPSRFFAFNAATGAIKWTFTANHGFESPVVFHNSVISPSYDRVFSLNRYTGEKQWAYEITGRYEEIAGTALVVDIAGVPYYSSLSGQVQ